MQLEEFREELDERIEFPIEKETLLTELGETELELDTEPVERPADQPDTAPAEATDTPRTVEGMIRRYDDRPDDETFDTAEEVLAVMSSV
ncbi:MAG: hypothetical protein ABEH65_09170 [Halobacteriales archaeon]